MDARDTHREGTTTRMREGTSNDSVVCEIMLHLLRAELLPLGETDRPLGSLPRCMTDVGMAGCQQCLREILGVPQQICRVAGVEQAQAPPRIAKSAPEPPAPLDPSVSGRRTPQLIVNRKTPA
jgi:hypothetical protein